MIIEIHDKQNGIILQRRNKRDIHDNVKKSYPTHTDDTFQQNVLPASS